MGSRHPKMEQFVSPLPAASIGVLWRNPPVLARLHHLALSHPGSSALHLVRMHHARRR
jgi:hypothetical protein